MNIDEKAIACWFVDGIDTNKQIMASRTSATGEVHGGASKPISTDLNRHLNGFGVDVSHLSNDSPWYRIAHVAKINMH